MAVTLKKQINPVTDAALDAAKNFIDGFESATNRFNAIASKQLQEGDPRTINELRKNRQNIEAARKELALKD